jgi:hypothetical protein
LVNSCRDPNLLDAVVAYEEILATDSTPMWSDEALTRLAQCCTVLTLAGARMLLQDKVCGTIIMGGGGKGPNISV